MRRVDRLRRRNSRTKLFLLIPLALLMVAGATVMGSGAYFTASSANPANVFTAGVLSHSNSKSGSAILTASNMKPGDQVSGTVTIKNTGTLAGSFSLAATNLSDTPGPNGGKLSDVLQIRIERETEKLYEGPIGAIPTLNAGSYMPGEEHTYTFTVTFPDSGNPGGATTGDNRYQGSSMSIDFVWTAMQQ
ncbi:MAG: CalY family protein [Thermoleophilia bacterium]|nr:CalY family protein [Thermoleophilia bacterium]